MESTLNSRMDELQNEMAQKFNTYSVQFQGLLTSYKCKKRENFLPRHRLPRGVHELSSSSEPTSRINEVKAVITLRSGKEVEQLVPKPVEEG